MPNAVTIYSNGEPVSAENPLEVSVDIQLGDTTINTTGLSQEETQLDVLAQLGVAIADLETIDASLQGIDTDTGSIAGSVTAINTKTPALGQALAAASSPVVLPQAQIDSLVLATNFDAKIGATSETAPNSDTATAGLNGRLQRIAQNISTFIALFPTSLGQKAKATSLAVTLASDEDVLARVGAVTETAPSTDTASSGLNGRLQRIAQRITSLLALVPAALTAGGNFKVALLEEIPAGTQTIGKANIGTIDMPGTLRNNQVTVATGGTKVQLSASSVALLNGVTVRASIDNTTPIYVGNSTVTATNGYELPPGHETFIAIDNLNKIYADIKSGQSNQIVCYQGS